MTGSSRRNARGIGLPLTALDMHVHTTAGASDSQLDPDDLASVALGLGMSGMALTEHDESLGAPPAKGGIKLDTRTCLSRPVWNQEPSSAISSRMACRSTSPAFVERPSFAESRMSWAPFSW